MTKAEFIKEISRLETFYNKKFTKNELEAWFNELKDLKVTEFENIINELHKKSKFMPKLAEILEAKNQNNKSLNIANWNSSYWYKNLREFCEQDGIAYYDITKGPAFLLQPFK